MKEKHWMILALLAAAVVLMPACSGGGSTEDGAAAESGLRFEMMDIAGVTTDHASSGGAAWIDFDGDGGLDLSVTNGYDVSSPEPAPQPNRLYRNDGTGGFQAITTGRLVEAEAFSSGNSWADYDNDGDLDLLIANWPNRPGPDEPNRLYRNAGNANHGLQIRLVGNAGNRSAIGARVFLTTGNGVDAATQIREIGSHTGFRGQSEMTAHFGLGDASEVSRLEIRWPSGERSTQTDVTLDRWIEIVQP